MTHQAPGKLPNAEFLFFLRLIVALYETENGFVPRGIRLGGGLVDEGIYPADSLDQALNRLRYWVGPALHGLDPLKFIEVQRGKYQTVYPSALRSNKPGGIDDSSGCPYPRAGG